MRSLLRWKNSDCLLSNESVGYRIIARRAELQAGRAARRSLQIPAII